jgi:hypothetical protein
MVPVIAIPYWAPTLRMPPAGVKTEGLVAGLAHARRAASVPPMVAVRSI